MSSIDPGIGGRASTRFVRHAVRYFLAALGEEARIRRDIARLGALGDRDLADIGLHRSGIRDAVRRGRRA